MAIIIKPWVIVWHWNTEQFDSYVDIVVFKICCVRIQLVWINGSCITYCRQFVSNNKGKHHVNRNYCTKYHIVKETWTTNQAWLYLVAIVVDTHDQFMSDVSGLYLTVSSQSCYVRSHLFCYNIRVMLWDIVIH